MSLIKNQWIMASLLVLAVFSIAADYLHSPLPQVQSQQSDSAEFNPCAAAPCSAEPQGFNPCAAAPCSAG